MSKEVILKNLNEIQELVNDDKKFKYKSIVNFNCEHIKEELESIDNVNPSEALECLEEIYDKIRLSQYLGVVESAKLKTNYTTIKQALLKTQEPKQYLKWEDLVQARIYKVLLNGNQYEVVKRYDDYEYCCITLQKKPNVSIYIYEHEKEVFNDLHLERVEE